MRSRLWNEWLFAFFCWTALALVFAGQSYVYGEITGENKNWSRVFLWTFADWYLWAALSPVIFWLARRFRFENGEWAQPLLAHLAGAAAFSLLHLLLQSVLQILLGWSKLNGALLTTFVFLFFKKIHLNFLTYAGIVGVSHAVFYYRRYHERKAEAHKLAANAHRLEAELARAQLQALQMQLNPHFLFNTLNALSEMIHRDQTAADRMVARLGDLLRMSLEREAAGEVTVKQELEFLQKYLEIEQLRFHDRLKISFDVDSQTLDALVPSMILQPLVENAVKHGIAALPGSRLIEIKATKDNQKLKLAVRDNGAGLPENWNSSNVREGIGLSNTRRRLERLYDGQHHFEMHTALNGGTEVQIAIPFRSSLTANDALAAVSAV